MPLMHSIQNPVRNLTPKEKIILERLLEGDTNKIIAYELGISPETVKSHAKSIFRKYNVSSRVQLLSKIIEELRISKGRKIF